MTAFAIREQFPISQSYAYFNHAAISPLPRCAAEAMNAQIAQGLHSGIHSHESWLREQDALRDAAAAMLGCGADEIAITKNTSEGLLAVANGIDWRPGDTVVGLESDFPANYVPWKNLRERFGVGFRSLQLRDGALDLEDLDRACSTARLAALSYVHFLTGFRWNLQAAGEICRRHGCLLVVDAVQGLGAFPVDVKACGIHALSASGHKWLLGPEGCAVFYIDRDWMPEINPVELGWTGLQGFEEYRSDGDIQPDARRFECGTLNTVGCAGLRASIEMLNAAGAGPVEDAIHALADRLEQGAVAKGYETAATRSRTNGSGIVSLRKRGLDSADAVEALLRQKVSTAERLGWVRVAPHCYNTAEEVDTLLDLLP